MPIIIAKEEQWALNILTEAINKDLNEVKMSVAAKEAYVRSLATKYDCDYDPNTLQLVEKPKEPKKPKKERKNNKP